MKTLVKKAALDLIHSNGATTTLEVKQRLIATEPVYYWKQSFISSTLAELESNGELEFTDNGTFRTYHLPNSQPAVMISVTSYKKIPLSQRSVVKVNLTDLAKLVEGSAGKFVTLVHTKKTTGQSNTMNCQILKGLTPLGAIRVKEQGQLKTVYPTNLLEVRMRNTVYQLK